VKILSKVNATHKHRLQLTATGSGTEKDPNARRHSVPAETGSGSGSDPGAELNDLESHSCQRAAMRTGSIHGTFLSRGRRRGKRDGAVAHPNWNGWCRSGAPSMLLKPIHPFS